SSPDGQQEPEEQPDPLGVLAEILGRDCQALSASQTWRQALADADHLAVLNAIWTAETSGARDQRYRDLLTAALPPGCEHEPGHRDKWLCKNGRRRGPATHSARPAPAPGTPTSQRSTQAHGANPASLATLQPK
ncbi:MAG: hypothetical protein ACRDOI_44555, partial [Trebonia sp.]